MSRILSPEEISPADRHRVGGKGYALSLLVKSGFNIPATVCITSDVYQEYVSRTGLRERIMLELHRKEFKEMRWEEIWDCATRIRNMFLTKPIPQNIELDICRNVEAQFRDTPVAVRSSAPEEDGAKSSFAGLHESFVNVAGTKAILKHVRLVWASLWSDAALLYRQEIGLDAARSTMAVVVQASVSGDRSGVVFTQSPNDESQGVIESVYGLNQGLVDGAVEPDRWIIERLRRTVVSHTSPERKYWIVPAESGVRLAELPEERSSNPPLNSREVSHVFETALEAEAIFKKPLDIEWTYAEDSLVLLQSRPITTLRSDKPEDDRGWYLSLHRSFENLKKLRQKIEDELIPGMISVAKMLSEKKLGEMSDRALAAEIRHRGEINHEWVNIYWADFIPFAHGVRLFGQVYNDAVRPEDPYEFIDLLANTDMASIERNDMLLALAAIVRNDQRLTEKLKSGDDSALDPAFLTQINAFIEKFGDLSCAVTGGKNCVLGTGLLYKLLLEIANHPPQPADRRNTAKISELRQRFLNCFEGDDQMRASELLELARTSYQLRDDDNIYLGRIEAQLLAAVQEARQRLEKEGNGRGSNELRKVLADHDFGAAAANSESAESMAGFKLKARQIIGQPAGPGISRGKARVIHKHGDLADFKYGEVLVCDAVDPNITFVVPLAAAVVERRGGMLIHGAIIAREYGLPCVTGVPQATSFIRTGDDITVDGYLGIVTVGDAKL